MTGLRSDRQVAARMLAKLRSGRGRDDPYAIYTMMRKMGPILPTPWGSLLVTGYNACAELLKTSAWEAVGANWRDEYQPGWRRHQAVVDLTDSMILMNAPEHTLQRRAVAPHMTMRAVNDLIPVITRLVDDRMDALEFALRHDGRADFAHLVSGPLPVSVMCALLGLPESDSTHLDTLAHALSAVQEFSPTVIQLQGADEAVTLLRNYLADHVRHRPRAASGLLAKLLEMSDRNCDGLRADLLVAMLLGAGRDTSSAMLSSIALAMATHHDQGQWLKANLEAVPAAVHEVSRWDPAAQVVSRVAVHDSELAGIPVRRGQLATALIGSAQRDPQILPDPDRLDLSRPPERILTFGIGAHYCVGAVLAQLQGNLVMRAILERFPTLRLAGQVIRPRGIAFREVSSMLVELG